MKHSLLVCIFLAPLSAFAQSADPSAQCDTTAPCQNQSITVHSQPALPKSEVDAQPADTHIEFDTGYDFSQPIEFSRKDAEAASDRFDFKRAPTPKLPAKASSPRLLKALIAKTGGTDKKPVLETQFVWDNGTITREPVSAKGISLWNAERLAHPSAQVVNVTGRIKPQPAPATSNSFLKSAQPQTTPSPNRARDTLEDMLDIPPERRGKDGKQCSEYTSPDGSYRESGCSQSWSWSSSK